MNIHQLITQLSNEPALKPLKTPRYYITYLAIKMLIYGIGMQLFLGLRPDLLTQLARPLFMIEILLLVSLVFSSIVVSVLLMYPDHYQKRFVLLLPYISLSALIVLILFQLFMPYDSRMIIPETNLHTMRCALCIASVAVLPSAIIFSFLRRGATIMPLRAGFLAVCCSAGIGCLTLRLEEMNDSLLHSIQWHYIPTFCFAMIGAWIGKYLLRW